MKKTSPVSWPVLCERYRSSDEIKQALRLTVAAASRTLPNDDGPAFVRASSILFCFRPYQRLFHYFTRFAANTSLAHLRYEVRELVVTRYKGSSILCVSKAIAVTDWASTHVSCREQVLVERFTLSSYAVRWQMIIWVKAS